MKPKTGDLLALNSTVFMLRFIKRAQAITPGRGGFAFTPLLYNCSMADSLGECQAFTSLEQELFESEGNTTP